MNHNGPRKLVAGTSLRMSLKARLSPCQHFFWMHLVNMQRAPGLFCFWLGNRLGVL